MKTRIKFIIAALAFAMTGMSGNNLKVPSGPAGINYQTPKRPTFETNTGGLDIQVWVMTREEHEQMMNEMKNNESMNMNMDKEGKMNKMGNDSKKTGTHHLKMVVSDAGSGNVRNDLNSKVKVTSPTKISTTIGLKNMSDHYGSDLTLNEKGDYIFLITLDDKGTAKTAEFTYKVQ